MALTRDYGLIVPQAIRKTFAMPGARPVEQARRSPWLTCDAAEPA
jgi:hypothetical protein